MKSLIKNTAYIAILLACFLFSPVISHAYDTTNKNEGKIVTSSKVDTSIPKWFKPSTNKDINYRLGVLPLEKYRYHDQYYVIPAMGFVAPLVSLQKTGSDYKLATKGKQRDYNKYLEWWAIVFPGTAEIGQSGNSFVFTHSSWWLNKPWDFKTIGRLYHNIETWDKIWVYKKISWKRYFYEYTVTLSKKIKASETWILLPEKGKVTFSSATCYEYGTAKDRWAFRSELTYVSTLDKVLNPIKPSIRKRSSALKTTTQVTVKP